MSPSWPRWKALAYINTIPHERIRKAPPPFERRRWKCFGRSSGYNRRMALEQRESSPTVGSDIGAFPESRTERGVFVLVVFRDGNLTAAVHTTERSAKEAADELLGEEGGTLESRFARVQRLVADEGGVMKVISSPVFGG